VIDTFDTLRRAFDDPGRDADAQAELPAIAHLADQHHGQRSTLATDRDAMGAQEPEGLADRAPKHRRDLSRRHALRGHAPQVFSAAFDRKDGDPSIFTVAYVVRAVSPGRYAHPQASVEDMYRPDRFGRTASGTVEITAAQ
jgi:hypothetical protein